jgi:hypothetical protein
MSDQANGLRDDISYLRNMAEQGRRGPLLGGIFLAAAGLIYGAAAFVHWAVETGRINLPYGNIWIGATVLFVLVWVVLFLRMWRSPQVAVGASQFTFGTAWAGSGAGIIVTLIAVAIASAQLHDPRIMNVNALVAFAFYGTAWCVTGALSHQRWMFAVAVLSFAVTLVLAFALNTPNELPVMGVGLLLTLFVPGMKLTLAAR